MESSFDFTYSHFPVSEEIVSYIKKKVGIDDNCGFFAFIKAEYKNNFDGEQVNKNNYVKRCDLDSPQGTPLPVDFHSWDVEAEKCTVCGSKTKPHPTTGSHFASLSNSKTLRMPIQSNYGFITYIETNDEEVEMGMMEAVNLAKAPAPVTSEPAGTNTKSINANNHGAFVILQCAGNNFRCGSRAAINQHHNWRAI
jgi:hypothetical protein